MPDAKESNTDTSGSGEAAADVGAPFITSLKDEFPDHVPAIVEEHLAALQDKVSISLGMKHLLGDASAACIIAELQPLPLLQA